MKMDEKYFEGKIEQLNEFEDFYFYSEAHATLIEKPEVKAILHQIAEDAFTAGAEAQRHKCFPDCAASNSCPCESATVKWEVPGE